MSDKDKHISLKVKHSYRTPEEAIRAIDRSMDSPGGQYVSIEVPTRGPLESYRSWFKRVREIDLKKVCAKIVEVKVSQQSVVADIVPYGPAADQLESMLDAGEGLQLSVRCFKSEGVCTDPITYDVVVPYEKKNR